MRSRIVDERVVQELDDAKWRLESAARLLRMVGSLYPQVGVLVRDEAALIDERIASVRTTIDSVHRRQSCDVDSEPVLLTFSHEIERPVQFDRCAKATS